MTPWFFKINRLDLRRTKDVINIKLVKTTLMNSQRNDQQSLFNDGHALFNDLASAPGGLPHDRGRTLTDVYYQFTDGSCQFTEMIPLSLAQAQQPFSFAATK